MIERNISCCFTGHRPGGLPWGMNENDPRCKAMLESLKEQLNLAYAAGYRHFICGMALGCDTHFAHEVMELRHQHRSVSLEAAVPCPGQSAKWTGIQQLHYELLLDMCDKVSLISPAYTPECMMRRNRYMVDKSSRIIACFNGRPSGTMNTIRYAMGKGLELCLIDI